jgi:hypothetical protein
VKWNDRRGRVTSPLGSGRYRRIIIFVIVSGNRHHNHKASVSFCELRKPQLISHESLDVTEDSLTASARSEGFQKDSEDFDCQPP